MTKYKYSRKQIVDRFQSFYYGNRQEGEFVDDLLALADKPKEKCDHRTIGVESTLRLGRCIVCDRQIINSTLKKIDLEWPNEINKIVLAEKINEIIDYLLSKEGK